MYRFFSKLAQKHSRKILLILTLLVGISLILAFISLTEATMKKGKKIKTPEREALIMEALKKAKDFYIQGKPSDAILTLKECRKNCGDDPRILTEMGYAYELMGDLKKAESFYRKALKKDPEFFAALNNLGNLYLKTGKKEKALELLKKASLIQPDSYMVHYSLGLLYQSMGELQNAISEYRVVLSLNQSYPDVYMMLGMLYDKAGNYQEAFKFYSKFLEMYPKGVPEYEKVAHMARERMKELLSGGNSTTLH